MMHLEILVEEPSAEAALVNLLPRIVGENVTFKIHPHQGKGDLLKKLPAKLKGYRRWIPKDCKIVVLIDRDGDDCHELKKQMESIAGDCGFTTISGLGGKGNFTVINRIAIEELEAWFFGDVEALRRSYPEVPETLAEKRQYRNPDAIGGGTWEALERVLKKAGYYPRGYPKIAGAKRISAHMDPEVNRSKSFQVFREALKLLRQSSEI